MPLKLDIKKQLSARSDRVKSVDFHPTEPWVLAGLYSGTVMIWDYNTQALVRQMEVSNLPIRCCKFVLRRQWIIAGCDDMTVKILNYNTLEKIKSLEGHTDYLRYIAVHPTMPLVLTSSDDMTIRMWDWEKNWTCVATYEGHSHYVMMTQWNPKDNSSFASASLDRSIKIWGISGGTNAHFTLNGHQRGVNCLDYAQSGEKPYLVSGSDDKTVRVWDYQTKQCVHVLEGHSANVSSVVFHPQLPIILTGSEDGICKVWHSTTYRLETSLNYMLDRLWSIAVLKGSNSVALGYDEGTVVVKLGSDEPVVSYCGGKLIWAKGVDIQTVNLRQIDESNLKELTDGDTVPNLPVKDMGACELFPQTLSHHPSGRMFSVCGDGEFVIYTSQALRNKSFGQAVGFAWSPEGHYATREANGKIVVYHSFKEAFSFRPDFPIDDIHSGELLAVRGPEFVVFYDWNEYRVVRRIDVVASNVYWSESGKFVAISTLDNSVFVLSFDKEAVVAASAGGADPEEGIEIAFDLHNEINETVRSGVWVSDSCFVFINEKLKLNTLVGGQVEVVSHLDHPLTVLGFLPEHGRVYCCDKSLNVCSFELDLNLVKYKSAVASNDLSAAEELFGLISESHHTKLARFLENQGYRAEAFEITKDPEHKFDLALSIGKLDVASNLVDAMPAIDKVSIAAKRRLIGDKAIEVGDINLAQDSYIAGGDSSSLLLIASCTGDAKLLIKVVELAQAENKVNVEVMARTLLGDVKGCVHALLKANKKAEAVLFARTYCPSMLETAFPIWKAELDKINPQLARAVANPLTNSELFQGLSDSIKAEQVLNQVNMGSGSKYSSARQVLDLDLVSEINQGGEAGLMRKIKAFTGSEGKPISIPVKESLEHISPRKEVTLPVSPKRQIAEPKPASPKMNVESPKAKEPSPRFHSPSSSVRGETPVSEPIRSVSPPERAPVTSRPLPTPPSMPTRLGASTTLPAPPTALRGPPPMPSRVLPGPPTSIHRPPEDQVARPTPESQVHNPQRAPESTHDEVDDLM
jgi:coatomer subunit beta'